MITFTTLLDNDIKFHLTHSILEMKMFNSYCLNTSLYVYFLHKSHIYLIGRWLYGMLNTTHGTTSVGKCKNKIKTCNF